MLQRRPAHKPSGVLRSGCCRVDSSGHQQLSRQTLAAKPPAPHPPSTHESEHNCCCFDCKTVTRHYVVGTSHVYSEQKAQATCTIRNQPHLNLQHRLLMVNGAQGASNKLVMLKRSSQDTPATTAAIQECRPRAGKLATKRVQECTLACSGAHRDVPLMKQHHAETTALTLAYMQPDRANQAQARCTHRAAASAS
jgi:hypothetical protein